eukprot:4994068-Pleurochrysis_carterae.AAC.5
MQWKGHVDESLNAMDATDWNRLVVSDDATTKPRLDPALGRCDGCLCLELLPPAQKSCHTRRKCCARLRATLARHQTSLQLLLASTQMLVRQSQHLHEGRDFELRRKKQLLRALSSSRCRARLPQRASSPRRRRATHRMLHRHRLDDVLEQPTGNARARASQHALQRRRDRQRRAVPVERDGVARRPGEGVHSRLGAV